MGIGQILDQIKGKNETSFSSDPEVFGSRPSKRKLDYPDQANSKRRHGVAESVETSSPHSRRSTYTRQVRDDTNRYQPLSDIQGSAVVARVGSAIIPDLEPKSIVPAETRSSQSRGPHEGTGKLPSKSKRQSPSLSHRGSSNSLGASSSKSIPKKGTFREIMARGRDAQARMGQVGKIQHKPLEKIPSKRERQDLKAEQARISNKKGASMLVKRSTRAPAASASEGRIPLNFEHLPSRVGSRRSPQESSEANHKKAAHATTGYQGTARPRPGRAANLSAHSSTARPNGRSRTGSLLSSRLHYSHGSKYDDLDDFIDDDENDHEEVKFDHHHKQLSYSYISEEEEDESDMEAGLSDIDQEERRAAYYAQKEDEEQQRLEIQLKRQKAERKRARLQHDAKQ